MKIKKNADNPRITVVCCTHGDEQFGLRVFEYLHSKFDTMQHLQLIIANESAIKNNIRFVYTDLNRVYPGVAGGEGELSLAHDILQQVQNSEYVLDIHTTHSDVGMIPIVTKIDDGIRAMLRHTSSKNIVQVADSLGDGALINHVRAGMGLEFGREFSEQHEEEALEMVEQIVRGITNAAQTVGKERDVFFVNDVLPDTIALPRQLTNFEFVPELGIYPFLPSEKAYKGIHCLLAREKGKIVV